MFCYRPFLRSTNRPTVDKIFSLNKSTNSGKSELNVIKSNNTINKNLFGSLLETQQQRRKRLGLSKALKFPKDDKQSSPTDLHTDNLTKKHTSEKLDLVSFELHSPELVSCSTSTSCTVPVEPTCQDSSTKKSKKTKPVSESKSKKSSSKKPKLVDNERATDNILVSIEKQFIFKSVEELNDTNYPLENPEKINFLKDNDSIESVLSYSFSDPLVKGYMKYPSVSKIMEETMTAKSKLILKRWRQNMISDLGEDGFAEYSAGLKARGHDFHEAVRQTLLGEAVGSCSDVTQNGLKSLDWMLKLTSNPLAVESIIAHPQLEYKGIPDCVAMFRKIPVIIDWKLSDKPKKDLKDTYEAPLQITAYIGALNHDPNYKWGVNHGLVAVAYTSGDPCDVFLLAPKHCAIYWRYWLQRFDKFKARSHLHVDHDIDESTLGS